MLGLRRQIPVRGLAVLLVPALFVTVLAGCGAGEDEGPVIAQGSPAEGGPIPWERLPDPAFPSRQRTVPVWTGEEVLLLGGDNFVCGPAASCVMPSEPPLADGVAVDLATGGSRPVATAPVGFYGASTAVIGEDVYLLAATDYGSGSMFLHYDVAADTWSTPPEPPGEWKRLVAAGDVLVAYTGSEERGETGDFAFDAETGAWTPLPEDPKSPGFDRSMVWAAPHLYLFDKEHVPNPGSERPSIVRAARLDLTAGTWEDLPDSEVIGGWERWIVDGDQIVTPLLGGADGGEVNGWGRQYRYGGVFDISAATWQPLPDGPADELYGAGAFGETTAGYYAIEGSVLDLRSGEWVTMTAFVDQPIDVPMIVTAGRDAITYVAGNLWIWRAPS